MLTTNLSDYCIAAIIRHFREKSEVGLRSFSSPELGISDLTELQRRWSLSTEVEELACMIIDNPNLLISSLQYSRVNTMGEVSGELQARDSVVQQLLTGDNSQFIVSEPSPTYINEANNLVAWVLFEAKSLLESIIRTAKIEVPSWVHRKRERLNSVLKNHVLINLSSSGLYDKRPSHHAKRAVSKSRNSLYRCALNAFTNYELIESLDQNAIKELLHTSLLSPLENWQLLELATGLSAMRALSKATGQKAILKLNIGNERLIGSVANFDIIWQNSLPSRDYEALDISEKMAKDIAQYIGRDISQSRVDISIFDNSKNADVAHFECKFSGNDAYLPQAISDASFQITRYVRDSRPNNESETQKLLANSYIVVASKGKFEEKVTGCGPIGFTDFDGLASGSLTEWANRLISD